MNFTKAAQSLHITQPAVSQHIRYLEEFYQVKLFDYEGKRLSLTPAGKLLLQAAEAVKNDETFLRERLRHACDTNFPIHFGTTRTIGESIVSDFLASYIRRHPDAAIRLVIGNTTGLLEKLQTGEIHFALVEGFFDQEEYDSMTYRTEGFIPVCSFRHRFDWEPKNLKDLLCERLLVREAGSGTREILEKTLDMKNLRLQDFAQVTEIGSMHVILELLARDMGVSFLYRVAAAPAIESGLLRELKLKDFRAEHNFTFIWNRGSIYSEVYRQVCLELSACE